MMSIQHNAPTRPSPYPLRPYAQRIKKPNTSIVFFGPILMFHVFLAGDVDGDAGQHGQADYPQAERSSRGAESKSDPE